MCPQEREEKGCYESREQMEMEFKSLLNASRESFCFIQEPRSPFAQEPQSKIFYPYGFPLNWDSQ